MESEIKEESVMLSSPHREEASSLKKETDSQKMQIQFKKDQSVKASGSGSPFLQSSWLYNLAKLNKMNFRQLLTWITQLYQSLQQSPSISYQPIFKFQFRKIKAKAHYYCLILPSSKCFSVMKVRDHQGNIVYFRMVPSQSISKEIKYLQSIIGQHNILLLDDQTGIPQNFEAVQATAAENLVFIHPYKYSTKIVDDSRGYCYRKAKESMFYYCKKVAKKLPAFEDILDHFISFEEQDRSTVLSVLGNTFLQYYDGECLIQTIIRNLKEQYGGCTIEQVLEFIQVGKDYLEEMTKLFDNYKNQHFPKNASTRQICSMCRKKKSEVQCESCSSITGQSTHLCLGQCFIDHHQLNSRLSEDPNNKLSHHLAFYDSKIEHISTAMMSLLQNGDQQELLLCYIRWSTAKIISKLNTVAVKKIGTQ